MNANTCKLTLMNAIISSHMRVDEQGVPKAPKSWSRDDCEHFLVQLVCESILGFEYVAFITPTAVMSMGVGMFV